MTVVMYVCVPYILLYMYLDRHLKYMYTEKGMSQTGPQEGSQFGSPVMLIFSPLNGAARDCRGELLLVIAYTDISHVMSGWWLRHLYLCLCQYVYVSMSMLALGALGV